MCFCGVKRVYAERVPIGSKIESSPDRNFLMVVQDLRFYLLFGPAKHILAHPNCKLECVWAGVGAPFRTHWPEPGMTEGRPWMVNIALKAYEVAYSYLYQHHCLYSWRQISASSHRY